MPGALLCALPLACHVPRLVPPTASPALQLPPNASMSSFSLQVFFSSSTMKDIIAPAAAEAARRKGLVRARLQLNWLPLGRRRLAPRLQA